MAFFGTILQSVEGYTNSSSINAATTKNHSKEQMQTLESFRKVIKKIRADNHQNSIGIFTDEPSLYEACAILEDQSFRCGRDLLLAIFMKHIPQKIANQRISKGYVSWDASTEEILTDELGMNQSFALSVLEILKDEFEK